MLSISFNATSRYSTLPTHDKGITWSGVSLRGLPHFRQWCLKCWQRALNCITVNEPIVFLLRARRRWLLSCCFSGCFAYDRRLFSRFLSGFFALHRRVCSCTFSVFFARHRRVNSRLFFWFFAYHCRCESRTLSGLFATHSRRFSRLFATHLRPCSRIFSMFFAL